MEGEPEGGVGVCEDYRGVIVEVLEKAGSFDSLRAAGHIWHGVYGAEKLVGLDRIMRHFEKAQVIGLRETSIIFVNGTSFWLYTRTDHIVSTAQVCKEQSIFVCYVFRVSIGTLVQVRPYQSIHP